MNTFHPEPDPNFEIAESEITPELLFGYLFTGESEDLSNEKPRPITDPVILEHIRQERDNLAASNFVIDASEFTPDLLFGYHFTGESEDLSNAKPRPITDPVVLEMYRQERELQKTIRASSAAAATNGQSAPSLPAPQSVPGPDLLDWLNREFDS